MTHQPSEATRLQDEIRRMYAQDPELTLRAICGGLTKEGRDALRTKLTKFS